jgi:hypothetical protein
MRLFLALLFAAAGSAAWADEPAPSPAPVAAASAPAAPAPAKSGAKAALPPPVPIPPRFLQTRSKIAELYPDADRLPAIWDNDHDPFRYGYVMEDDPDATAAAGAGSAAGGKPGKRDLDTEALMEAGLDVTKGSKAPPPAPAPSGMASGLASLFGGGATQQTAPVKEFVPLNDAEILKRAVGKLRIGGVFIIRGAAKIMIDGANHKEGDILSVSIAGKRVNVKINELLPSKVVFGMTGAAGDTKPTVTVKF